MKSLQVKLTTTGPFVTAGEGAGSLGIDVPRAKDRDGAPVIPGTHVAGKLRESLVRMILMVNPWATKESDRVADEFGRWQQAERIAACLFGPRVPAVARTDNLTSAVRVGAFKCTSNRGETLNRIAIDRIRRTADDAALAFIEASAPGAEETWSGEVAWSAVAGLDDGQVETLLLAALARVEWLGQEGSTGFGRFRTNQRKPGAAEVKSALAALLKAPQPVVEVGAVHGVDDAPGEGPRRTLRLRITTESPLVVGDSRADDNLLMTRDDLPGSVLKRAFADALFEAAGLPVGRWVDGIDPGKVPARLKPLVEAFDGLHVRFAFPVEPGTGDRPRQWPMTSHVPKHWGWESAPGDALVEWLGGAAEGRDPGLHPCDSYDLAGRSAAGGESFSPRHLMVTRTAIDPMRLGSAESQLFSVRALAEGTEFLGEVSGPAEAITAIEGLVGSVAALGKGIRRGFGRVRVEAIGLAPADDWRERLEDFWKRLPGSEGRLVPVTCETDALLLPADVGLGTKAAGAYRAGWRMAFERLSLPAGASVDVTNVWACHRLRGGRNASGDLKKGPPTVLTGAGSVFVLAFSDIGKDALFALLEQLAIHGAEVPEYVRDVQVRSGVFCPWRASNGYGEVVICHPQHAGTGTGGK